MARELFIYWKLGEAQSAAAIRATAEMQVLLRAQHPGLQARLYRRADVKAGVMTLMEVYGHAAGVDAGLQAAIERAAAQALHVWQDAPRHVEVFETLGG